MSPTPLPQPNPKSTNSAGWVILFIFILFAVAIFFYLRRKKQLGEKNADKIDGQKEPYETLYKYEEEEKQPHFLKSGNEKKLNPDTDEAIDRSDG